MTPSEFRAWRARMGYTQQQAAAALGVSLRTVKSWESGFAAPPAFLPLACAALAAGLGPWGDNDGIKPQRPATSPR